jgi:TorA maturation chaperone TorD
MYIFMYACMYTMTVSLAENEMVDKKELQVHINKYLYFWTPLFINVYLGKA